MMLYDTYEYKYITNHDSTCHRNWREERQQRNQNVTCSVQGVSRGEIEAAKRQLGEVREELHLRWKGEAFHQAVCGRNSERERWKRRKRKILRILLAVLLLIAFGTLVGTRVLSAVRTGVK